MIRAALLMILMVTKSPSKDAAPLKERISMPLTSETKACKGPAIVAGRARVVDVAERFAEVVKSQDMQDYNECR